MDDLIVKSVSVSEFPQVSREALRDSVADKLAKILVERQLQELRVGAIEAVRQALRATIDQAIDEALAAVEHEDDAAWDQWKKVLGEAPVKN
jgi:hypothetical protein